MNQLKKYLLPLLLLLVLVSLTACGSTGEDQTEKEGSESSEKASEETKEADFPITVTDALGNEVTIEEQPESIVSLIPSNTEITYALGMGDAVVGVTDFDNYPEEVAEVEKIGGMEFNVEKIISLQPDVVLAHASGAHNSEAGLKQLQDAGINVIVVKDATSIDGAYDSINFIGQVTGTTEKADEIVNNMKERLGNIEEKAATISEEDKKNVWVEISGAPEIYTAGKGTFIDEMIQAVGAINVAADLEGWPKVTEEDAVLFNPDIIVLTYGYYTENALEKVLGRDAWKDVPAIQEEQVYDIHSDKVTRPGPRLIEGVEELAKAIYPDVY
ncbi:ABC transporter substrate-binding protein [Metabacillus herbersteinensis]|uniref:ABC transporter substrate-binding protein n=1 Tax=Metabacillus herbersteinensis TaxID=283816 RepID=A0ABV6GCZ5_9BACI